MVFLQVFAELHCAIIRIGCSDAASASSFRNSLFFDIVKLEKFVIKLYPLIEVHAPEAHCYKVIRAIFEGSIGQRLRSMNVPILIGRGIWSIKIYRHPFYLLDSISI